MEQNNEPLYPATTDPGQDITAWDPQGVSGDTPDSRTCPANGSPRSQGFLRAPKSDRHPNAGLVCSPKDYLGEIQALFEWVQKNVRYTKDPYRVEVLHSARRMLELRAGDCDDMTILLAAMLEAIGHPTRLVIIGPDPASAAPVQPHLSGSKSQRKMDPTRPYHAFRGRMGAQ